MTARELKIIGLTGPIAAGKNEVAKLLRRHGAYIIDADRTAHQLYAPQSEVWHGLVKAFGARVLNRGGRINRKKLGEIVFADRQKLKELNGIVHPALQQEIKKLVAGRQGLTVINAAVLREIGLVDLVDEVWVVTASREKRLKRLIGSGLAKAAALKRMNAQAAPEEYREIADVVIRNEGTRKQLHVKVQAFL